MTGKADIISRKRALNTFFFAALILNPLSLGPTVRYALALSVIGSSVLYIIKNRMRFSFLLPFFSSPPLAALFLWNFFAFVSVNFSPEPLYSLRTFFSEFFLNSLLFIALGIAASILPSSPVAWKSALKRANIIFLLLYLILMLYWILFPHHLLFGDKEFIARFIKDKTDIIFEFGRACEIFCGIHRTSLYLALMIAYWSIFPARLIWENLVFIFLNFFTLFTTTRRGALIASMIGLLFSVKLSGRKQAAAGVAAVTVSLLIGASLFYSQVERHFVREDWGLIAKGQIEMAKMVGGSIPLRISTYREFTKEIVSHPFMPRGLGKKLIKEYWKDLVKRAGLQHGHNTFLNQAFYMGIQGAAALVAIIISQFCLFWRAMKTEDADTSDRQLMKVAVVFMVIYWITNLFGDGFQHGSAALYWLVTGLAAGRAFYVTRVRTLPDHPEKT